MRANTKCECGHSYADHIFKGGCMVFQFCGEACTCLQFRLNKRAQARRERDQAMRDMGLVRVRGALGGVYWE